MDCFLYCIVLGGSEPYLSGAALSFPASGHGLFLQHNSILHKYQSLHMWDNETECLALGQSAPRRSRTESHPLFFSSIACET